MLIPFFPILLNDAFAEEYESKDGHNIGHLQQVIKQCEACHASNSEIPSTAPVLDGIEAWYLLEQLHNFSNNARGFASTNPIITEMSRQAQGLDDRQLTHIANYYSDRDAIFSKETVLGNSESGENIYKESCEGCHASFFGRFFTGSPKIAHLEGPYLLAQLKLFAADNRLFLEANKHKNKMIEVTKRFSDEELSDIVAYIKSHLNE